jgi:hypothetical protein
MTDKTIQIEEASRNSAKISLITKIGLEVVPYLSLVDVANSFLNFYYYSSHQGMFLASVYSIIAEAGLSVYSYGDQRLRKERGTTLWKILVEDAKKKVGHKLD